MSVRFGSLLILALLLGACAGHRARPVAPVRSVPSGNVPQTASRSPETSLPQAERYQQNRDGESGVAVDVDAIPEPVPHEEPRSRYGNRSPYSVLGRSYSVLPTSKGYVERGIASWYGNKFHGYMTSSFEPYDMYQFSAAHKSLPLPSWAKVINLKNGKSVVVRVNDRGPFHDNRIIDLSYAAAVKIGVWPAGTGLVEVRALQPGEDRAQETQLASHLTASAQARDVARASARSRTPVVTDRQDEIPGRSVSSSAPVMAHSAVLASTHERSVSQEPQIFLQVGSYGEMANAERAAQQLGRANLGQVSIIDAEVNGHHVRRVRIGPLKDAEAADQLAAQVRRLGLGHPQVAID
ncbi:MAG: septal ring lytic transglycosylase RlpA family protein [Tahibacter sp.]